MPLIGAIQGYDVADHGKTGAQSACCGARHPGQAQVSAHSHRTTQLYMHGFEAGTLWLSRSPGTSYDLAATLGQILAIPGQLESSSRIHAVVAHLRWRVPHLGK